jgi:hypothetical protein
VNRDPDERAQPEGGAAPDEFDAIVALWRREGDVPQWPDGQGPDGQGPDGQGPDVERPDNGAKGGTPDTAAPAGSDEPAPPARPPRPRSATSPPFRPHAPLPEDEHFVPPEPPPLPRLGPPAFVGLTLIVLGLVLVVAPGWLGIAEPYGLPLGLVGLAAGLGWLVLRLWPDPPDRGQDDDGDDGAVI